jgi:hypothetical protein
MDYVFAVGSGIFNLRYIPSQCSTSFFLIPSALDTAVKLEIMMDRHHDIYNFCNKSTQIRDRENDAD